VGRLVIGGTLVLLSLLMLLGFVRSDATLGSAPEVLAFLLSVGLPGVAGAALLVGRSGSQRRIAARKDQLRRQTLEAEILRLASAHGGKITVVELVRELAVTPEAAQTALDAMHLREMAEIEITDSGVLVYVFHDLAHLGEKGRSRGLLDA
jgi:hypothetical protein